MCIFAFIEYIIPCRGRVPIPVHIVRSLGTSKQECLECLEILFFYNKPFFYFLFLFFIFQMPVRLFSQHSAS